MMFLMRRVVDLIDCISFSVSLSLSLCLSFVMEKKKLLSSLLPSTQLTPVKKNTIEFATNDSASQKASNAPCDAGGRSHVDVEAP